MGRPRYDKLIGPDALYLMANKFAKPVPLTTLEDYRTWHRGQIESRKGETFLSEEPAHAYVNHGRWLIDCAWCGNAPLTHPDWGIACCAECGAVYEQGMVKFPEAAEEITAVLLERPKRAQQNWTTESMEALRKENEENL